MVAQSWARNDSFAMVPPGASGRGVEAAPLAGVTGRTGLADAVEHGVAVAVDAHLLHVAARVALPPELLAAARPVVGPSGAGGGEERLAVRPGQHEDGAVLLLRDDGNEAALVEPDGLERDGDGPAHGRTSNPRAARNAFASPTVCSPSWKMEAASAASAKRSPSARCSSVPTPPEAITGTSTARVTRSRSSRS